MIKNRALYGLLNLSRTGAKFSTRSYHRDYHSEIKNWKKVYFVGSAAALSGYAGFKLINGDFRFLPTAQAATIQTDKFIPLDRKDLPVFKLEDVKKHGKGADRIWVVYKQGVYDITEFHKNHPGGDKILLAAGGSIEPFWDFYTQHKTSEVMEILESLRIGNLDEKDMTEMNLKTVDSANPSSDPIRHPAVHMLFPDINEKDHRLSIEGFGVKSPIVLEVEDLKKKFEEVSVDFAIQCGRKRRAEANEFKKVQELKCQGTTIESAKWTGVRLRDLLILAGVDPNDKRIKHIHLEGVDCNTAGTHYGGSISFEKAMEPEVIVAYKMNDRALPREHGYPIRLIAPGIVGARNVKWLKTIRLSDVENPDLLNSNQKTSECEL